MGEGRTDRPGPYQRRVLVRDAAKVLGISEGAVRMRIKRGTLPSAREAGRLYVLLDTEPTSEPHRPHDRDNDRTSELIATLREQLEAERQAHAEARRLLMAALERIPPQLEAPQEARESPVSAEEGPEGPESTDTRAEAQEGPQRPWWRRIFGG